MNGAAGCLRKFLCNTDASRAAAGSRAGSTALPAARCMSGSLTPERRGSEWMPHVASTATCSITSATARERRRCVRRSTKAAGAVFLDHPLHLIDRNPTRRRLAEPAVEQPLKPLLPVTPPLQSPKNASTRSAPPHRKTFPSCVPVAMSSGSSQRGGT